MNYLPSTVLAVGYHQNFILPVCAALEAQAPVEIDGALAMPAETHLQVRIPKLPDRFLASADAGKTSLVPVVLRGERPMPMWLDPGAGTGPGRQLVDVPRNLSTLSAALDHCGLAAGTERDALLASEVENFHDVLEALCAGNTRVSLAWC